MCRSNSRVRLLVVALFLISMFYPLSELVSTVVTDGSYDEGTNTQSRIPAVHFEENVGQLANDDVLFYGSSNRIQVGFGESSVLLKSTERISKPLDHLPSQMDRLLMHEPLKTRGVLVRVSFVEAHTVKPTAFGELHHRSNYFVGNDPDKWRTNLPSYSEILYRELYDGIDLAYHWGEDGLKYEFRVHPGADLGKITMAYEGVEGLSLNSAGYLIVRTALGDLTDSAPYSYQGGGISVNCDFSLRGPLSHGFDCVGWDGSTTLVIDPLIYSTYLGGSFIDEGGHLAVDSDGNAYIADWTLSTDFPVTPGAFDEDYNGMWDAYVSKLSADGSTLLYSTYLGGNDSEHAGSIVVDSFGDVYFTGMTKSQDFPTTEGALDRILNGTYDAFVTKLNANGSALIYSTFLGGDDFDRGHSIAVDSDGNAYLAGRTMSSDFPTTPGAFDTSHDYHWDAFVCKLSANGSTLIYSTFLGGAGWDESIRSIAIDTSGNVFATGWTLSSDFPTTPGAFDESWNGNYDAFVTKINATGSGLVYSTFLGGNESDKAFSITVDSSGRSYVTGGTRSTDFPATPGAYNTTYDGSGSAFVTKLSANGSMLIYSTFLGGFDGDRGFSIAIDTLENAHVTGHTYSVDFPTTPDAFNRTLNGYSDVFVSKLDFSGSTLLYSTFLGGKSFDLGESIVVESPSCVYIAGSASSDFPVTPGAYDTTYNGSDAFVTKLDLGTVNTPPVVLSFSTNASYEGTATVFTVVASDAEDDLLTYSFDFDSDGGIDISGPNNTASYIWGDDYIGIATVIVSDGEFSVNATTQVEVHNVQPEVTADYTCTGCGPSDILLRIAGEKWHDVSFIIYEGGNEIYNETVMRVPGSPNEQMIGLESFSLNISRSYSAIARYTPEDDEVNGQKWGATPVWIILKSGGKEIARFHHTFNVRHPETWEWQVDDLSSWLPVRECIFTADTHDPGSDDLYITWDWGDGTTTKRIYYNNGMGPDPYPSPDVSPIAVTDTAMHSYTSGGSFTITLIITDDDSGTVTITFTLHLG